MAAVMAVTLLPFDAMAAPMRESPEAPPSSAPTPKPEETAPFGFVSAAPIPDAPVAATPDANGVIATAETKITDFARGRIRNIKLVSRKLDGAVIKPGAEFSFNKKAGPRTMKRGYRKAKIFVGDEKVMEIGGGICQVATTLYMAARTAGMQITERHPHGQDVQYAGEGDDATVFYNKLDLKFKNTASFPVRLDITVGDGKVTVRLLAVKENDKK